MTLGVRPAAVAGSFYPESAAVLASTVASLLAEAECSSPSAPPSASLPHPKAIIVPHAGYCYSGPIAARMYAPLRQLRERIRRVVLLGPAHRVAVNGLALPEASAFLTPLGAVPVDQNAIRRISDLPQVVIDARAHAAEHALEVQLPFLQTVLADFSLLPLAVGQASPAEVAEVLERLWGGDETLIVVSSDLSHYLPYATAQDTDRETTQQIATLQPCIQHHQACGATPLNGLLVAAKNHGLHARLVDLRNSGDTAGDKRRVVGYAAFAFSAGDGSNA